MFFATAESLIQLWSAIEIAYIRSSEFWSYSYYSNSINFCFTNLVSCVSIKYNNPIQTQFTAQINIHRLSNYTIAQWINHSNKILYTIFTPTSDTIFTIIATKKHAGQVRITDFPGQQNCRETAQTITHKSGVTISQNTVSPKDTIYDNRSKATHRCTATARVVWREFLNRFLRPTTPGGRRANYRALHLRLH